MQTIFFERSGDGAKEVLEAFRSTLMNVEGCQEVKLLESAQQAGLYLLVSMWTLRSEPPTAPQGTKLWVFREVEEVAGG